MNNQRIWSGETYDGQRVIFCDQGHDAILAAEENGRIVVRSIGGTMLGLTYDSDPEAVVEWLRGVANRSLGEAADRAEYKFQFMNDILAANPGSELKDQQDGNLVIYSAEGKAIWSSRFDNAELRKLIEARK